MPYMKTVNGKSVRDYKQGESPVQLETGTEEESFGEDGSSQKSE